MTVRILTRTTPGKPMLAAAIMAGLLALASLATWSVSFHRGHQIVQLGEPRALGEPRPMGDLTTIAPPAGWID